MPTYLILVLYLAFSQISPKPNGDELSETNYRDELSGTNCPGTNCPSTIKTEGRRERRKEERRRVDWLTIDMKER